MVKLLYQKECFTIIDHFLFNAKAFLDTKSGKISPSVYLLNHQNDPTNHFQILDGNLKPLKSERPRRALNRFGRDIQFIMLNIIDDVGFKTYSPHDLDTANPS